MIAFFLLIIMSEDEDYCEDCGDEKIYKDGLCKDCWYAENVIYCEDCGEETDDTLSHLCEDCHQKHFPSKKAKSNGKPTAKVTGTSANIMSVVNQAKRALVKAGKEGQAEELQKRIIEFEGDYHGAWGIVLEYVNLA